MVGFFTYPHKLTAALQSRGFELSDLPITREWIGLIHKFRKAGYSPEQAADLIDRASSRDPEALADVVSVGGQYAIAVFEDY